MLTYHNNVVKTSVRRLVEFLLRSGNIDLGKGTGPDVDAMQEGSRLHKKIQRAKKPSYQSEVPLKMSWEKEGCEIVLEGRADGIDLAEYEERTIALVDEIKCVYKDVSLIEEADVLHMAQAKCYACMYAEQKGLEEILIQITYCNIETEEKKYVKQYFKTEELMTWFYGLIKEYEKWASYYVKSRKKRNESLQKLLFPFQPRPGQKKMMAIVYQAIERKKHVFLQAPTGIGKTISTIYPAFKELSEDKGDRIFYLTAKTVTRKAAEQTINLLAEANMSLSSVSVTARDRICSKEKAECCPEACSAAEGHFDRINEALYALLTERKQIRREEILEYGKHYNVCPYELSFEAAIWADCIICDYNYIFDPHVNKKSLFSEKNGSLLLIDEAHNLLERARDMYSARIDRADFVQMKRYFKEKNKYLEQKLKKCNEVLLSIEKNPEAAAENVDSLYYPLFWMLGEMEEHLKNNSETAEREEILEFYFKTRHFFMILENMETGYEIYAKKTRGKLALRLLCVDPSPCIKECLDKCRSAIFFSATLLPVHYYKKLLGGSGLEDAFYIPSPFKKENRLLAITSDVTSRYSRRDEEQYRKIVMYLEKTVVARKGNYMIFFPSYKMLSDVFEQIKYSALPEQADFLVQEPSMGEEEREFFLNAFQENTPRSLIGFCVLGSIFSEGIDLAGNRLIGVLIVGTGLPQVCEEREQIRSYFDRQGKKGYDYAYRYPGVNKVLQAAGRVIRTAEDTGVILLMDDRFLQKENQELLPEEWDSYYAVNLGNYHKVLEGFWEKR